MISVIVPTYNEEKNIVNCLKSLNSQSIPRKDYEIIVVDGHSKDKTVSLAKKYADKIITQKTRWIAGARNDGAVVAKGDIIATTDADCIAHKNWLEEITNTLMKDNNIAVFGPVILSSDARFRDLTLFSLSNKITYILNKLNILHPIFTSSFAFKKEPFLEIGGFSDISILEDFEIGLRIKKHGKVIFNENMKVLYNLRRLKKQGLFTSISIMHYNMLKIIFGFKPDEKIRYAKQNYDE